MEKIRPIVAITKEVKAATPINIEKNTESK